MEQKAELSACFGTAFWRQFIAVRYTETEDNYGTYVYTFEYDLMGNRTYMEKTLNGTVLEWHRYEYNESNQQISEKLYNGKKTTGKEKNYEPIEYLNDVNR